MLRKRLIFGLIYADGAFMQSRNFRLQRVGDINWLEKNYGFQKISFSLDELIVVNANRGKKNTNEFSKIVNRLVSNVFIPVAAGGGIKKIEDAELLFKNGADKLVLNSILHSDQELVRQIIKHYGSQSVIASVDYKIVEERPIVYINNGFDAIDTTLSDYLLYLEKLGVGEILLNSIDKDGTGFGYDADIIMEYAENIMVPLIVLGGAGNKNHLHKGLCMEGVAAVATANLFNFIGDGLPNARKHMLNCGDNLATWE